MAKAQGKGVFLSLASELNQCLDLLPNGISKFVDVGANTGVYTEEILSKFPAASGALYEPSAFNCSILERKFERNNSISIYQCALSETEDTLPLYGASKGSGEASLIHRRLDHFGQFPKEVETVAVKRFDSTWYGGEVIDLVKIDVEGFELAVLKGFGPFLKNVRVVQFEMGGTNIDTKTFFQDFWYFFEAEGFTIYRITPLGLYKLQKYTEAEETFRFKNYVAKNSNL